MTLAARLGPHLPPRLIAAVAARVYPRFEPELGRLADFLAPGGTAVDVGGWYGPWTWHLARRADRVVTVEPVPHLARLIASVTPAHVEVVAAAASDHSGTATLWLPPGGRGDRGVSSLVRRELHQESLQVPALTLDELKLSAVTLIKIDVDGGELAVLRGCERTVMRDRPALFVELETRIQPLDPVLAWTAGHGYRGWVLPRDHWVPLADFDLAAHQSRVCHVAEHGLLRRSVAPHRRYVNSVLFLPEGRRPGAPTGAHLPGRTRIRTRVRARIRPRARTRGRGRAPGRALRDDVPHGPDH
ncbi:FkbM family methyltransferase [Streptomyces sp. MST-110588]|uniref:FkbM family methyltransferase n=1 Tax=Streptomyces sp. MST-110588 TaxID=2833628 RepID=UPI001F5CE51F|nr:FkbM family methyltransferase [Streptomyces sp. MST-110588]UNO42224.1 FkbM family methyltransferase [Streptomyces sp. MST-110588]